MHAVLIISAIVLTAAILVLVIYAIRALHQLTLTIRRLDDTLARSVQTMDHVDEVLDGVKGRLEKIDVAVSKVTSFGGVASGVASAVGGMMFRQSAGPIAAMPALAVAAFKGFQRFFGRKRPTSPK